MPPPSTISDWSPVSAHDWGISRAIDCIVGGMIWSGIMHPPSAPSASPMNTPSDPACSCVRAVAPTSIAAPAATSAKTITIAPAATGSPHVTPNRRLDTSTM